MDVMDIGDMRFVFNSLRPSDEYASVNRVSIGSDNGLSPIRHQAII